jgi:hypothetical protein
VVNLAEISLAPDVVWVGSLPGLMCRGAEQVKARLDQIREGGRTLEPEVLAERDGFVLIDPHVSAPPQVNPELHQILVVQDGVVQEIRDYPNRAAAEAAFEAMW